MPFLSLLVVFLVSSACSNLGPLKYKYSSDKRKLASLTQENISVAKVEVSLKDDVLFASGMDSTFVIVRLFDHKDNLVMGADPADLTLSSDVDIKAKPFTIKRGVYKAEILPKVKSASVKMRVDWRGRVLSDEIILSTTIKPRKNKLAPINHQYFESKSFGEVNVSRGSGTPESFTDGFSLENVGDNRIVNASKEPSASRGFHFEYIEQSRQNLLLQVSDSFNGSSSHTMHSLFMFFPRTQLPIVEQLIGTLNVTLPNGEKLVFQKGSKEIVSGIFLEGPLDMRGDHQKRQYADLRYKGQGVILRANARGQTPELGEFESEKIDQVYGLKGSVDVLIINGATGQRCLRPKTDFWESIDVDHAEFKFAEDEEFSHYLKEKCGFSFKTFQTKFNHPATNNNPPTGTIRAKILMSERT